MDINYVDLLEGVSVESRILEIIEAQTDLRSETTIAASRYEIWPIRYHLCPERSNLLRHLSFEGLDVLEIGAGMGAVSRFIAENARHLTVVEGTQARFAALSARLRDLSNWSGVAANIQDVESQRKYDVVCAIGVMEYSELYMDPPPGETPFSFFLKKAESFLKEDGVLILAIENKLGLKYWSGAPEDHTGRLFDGICGYSEGKSPKTFSRHELLHLVRQSGFGQIHEYFPFPDYKITSSVLTSDFLSKAPHMAADIMTGRPFEAYTTAKAGLFPDLLAMHTIGDAGLLTEFSNSFLLLAHKSSDSPTAKILQRGELERGEIGWHYGLGRKIPTQTTFSSPQHKESNEKLGPEPLRTQKTAGANRTVQSETFVADDFSVIWKALPATDVTAGVNLRYLLLKAAYFGDWDYFCAEIAQFVSWSFKKWAMPQVPDCIEGAALDAVPGNAMVQGANNEVHTAFELFDLEWILDAPLRKTWFVLRVICSLTFQGNLIFARDVPFDTLEKLYETLCVTCQIAPDFEKDTQSEETFQALVLGPLAGQNFHGAIETVLRYPLRKSTFPRDTAEEYKLRFTTNHRIETLEGEFRECNARLQNHEIALDAIYRSTTYRFAMKINRLLCKIPFVRSVWRAIS